MKYARAFAAVLLVAAGIAGFWFDKSLWGIPLIFGVVALGNWE